MVLAAGCFAMPPSGGCARNAGAVYDDAVDKYKP
jgi:hypothetical protein